MDDNRSFLEPEILENCTLAQAVEYIAFSWLPMDKRYETLIDRNREEINKKNYDKAKIKLELAIEKEKIFIFGRESICKVYVDDEGEYVFSFETEDTAEMHKLASIDFQHYRLYEKENALISEDILLEDKVDFADKHYFCAKKAFVDISVSFDELKKVFSDVKSEMIHIRDSNYSTPYLNIMLDVINEYNISKDYQPLKKTVEGWIEDKMKVYKLEPSKNKIEAMATFVRLPESQLGKAKK